MNQFPRLILIGFLIISVVLFNVVAFAFDLTNGSYSILRDAIHVLRDGSEVFLAVFIIGWGAWAVQKHLNWPRNPAPTASHAQATIPSRSAVFTVANGHPATRGGYTTHIRQNRYRR